MEALEVGARIHGFADKHARKVDALLADTEMSQTPAGTMLISYEIQMMGSMWQLAASMVKDLTDPLKSIVNK